MTVHNVKQLYKESFVKHGRDGKSLFNPKNRHKERFGSLDMILANYGKEFTLLDYGCGFGDLKQFLDEKGHRYTYFGVDIVDEFIDDNIQKYTTANFKVIKSHLDIENSYDFVAIFGVFNLLYTENIEEHKSIIQSALINLFEKTNVALCVNFMTDEVDFVQEGAYHQNLAEFIQWGKEYLSNRIIVNQSYSPYEFTVIFYKDVTRRSDSRSDYAIQYS